MMSTIEVLCLSTVFILLVNAKLSSAANDIDDVSNVKVKRAGTVGLFPFPRVGRSDPEMVNWESSNSAEDYEDFGRMEMKRQGLIPFPRVGRSESVRYWPKAFAQELAKRTGGGSGATGGMWFGPRLGKRSANKENYPTSAGERL